MRFDPPLPRHYDETIPHQWTRSELTVLADWVNARFAEIATDLGPTWDRVLDWTPGLSASSGVAVSGGGVGDDGSRNGRTQAAGLKAVKDGSSAATVDFHIIALGLVRVSKVVGRVAAAHDRLKAATPSELEDVLEDYRPGAGPCRNEHCDWICSGERNDRLRRFEGSKRLCLACYRYAQDHDGELRPHDIVHSDAVRGCKRCLRRELLEAGHDANDVVGLVDDRVKR